MKNVAIISFSIVIVVFVIGILGFFLFNKRLTVSKELKQSAEALKENVLPLSQQNIDMGAVESGINLQITSPSDQSTVTSSFVTLRGKTVAGAEVFVNEKEVVADGNGDFSVGLMLEEGDNPIMVVANDANGNVSEKEITIMYELSE